MKKNAKKALLAMAVVLTVLIGKGSEAKAYDIVGGKAYIGWPEYNEMSGRELEKLENGTVANGYEVIDLWEDENGVPIMNAGLTFVMDRYVPKVYFDYDWYLKKHPELVDICGTDKDAIYDFYANIGQANG